MRLELLDTLVDVILVVSPEGSIVYASPSAQTGLGYDPAELSTLRFEALFE